MCLFFSISVYTNVCARTYLIDNYLQVLNNVNKNKLYSAQVKFYFEMEFASQRYT